MYIPSSFRETNIDKLHDLIEKFSFATLVSDEPELFASHLPLLLERQSGERGRLIGHMARANRQWELADGRPVLVIFNGPHAYISPTWYQAANVVPTWNYSAVHVSGTLKVEEDPKRLLEIVERYVDYFEANQADSWSIARSDPDFIDGLLAAIVGFEIPIDSIEGKWKLNQNHDENRRQLVIDALQSKGDENSTAIAQLMREV